MTSALSIVVIFCPARSVIFHNPLYVILPLPKGLQHRKRH